MGKTERHGPGQYLAGHVKEALATDPRTYLLDVRVVIRDDRVFMVGSVEDAQQKRLAERVAREVVPEDMLLVNSLQIASYATPTQAEPL